MQDMTLPMRGGWIMITRQLPTVIQPPVLSIWYAQPDRVFPYGSFERRFFSAEAGDHLKDRDLAVIWRYRAGVRNLMQSEIDFAKEHEDITLEQRVKILTPWGSVCAEPYEWTPIPDINPYFQCIGDGVIMHEYGDTQSVSSKMEEQLFYMATRGLDRVSALRLLLGDIKKPNVVWLEIEKQYADYFKRAA